MFKFLYWFRRVGTNTALALILAGAVTLGLLILLVASEAITTTGYLEDVTILLYVVKAMITFILASIFIKYDVTSLMFQKFIWFISFSILIMLSLILAITALKYDPLKDYLGDRFNSAAQKEVLTNVRGVIQKLLEEHELKQQKAKD